MNGRIGKKTWMMIGLALAWLPMAGALAAESPLDTRINMGVHDAPADDTFRTFAKLMSAEAVVDPALKGTVTVELKNVRVRTLLDAVCESIGCRWELQPGNPPKLRVSALPAGNPPPAAKVGPKEPIDLKVTGADGKDILQTFGEVLGAEVVLDPAVTGTVTLDLANTPWDQALDAVCAALGCNWELVKAPKRVLKVVAKK